MRQTNHNENKRKSKNPYVGAVSNVGKRGKIHENKVVSPYGTPPSPQQNSQAYVQRAPKNILSAKNIVPKSINWPQLLDDEIKKYNEKDLNHKLAATEVVKNNKPYLYYAVEDLYEKRRGKTDKFTATNTKPLYGNSQPKYLEPFWVRQDPILAVIGTLLTMGFFWANWIRQQLFGLSLSLQIMLPDEAYTVQNMLLSPLKYSRLLVKYIEIVEKKYNLLRSPYEDLLFLAYFPPLFIYAAQKRLNKLSEFFSF